MSSSSSSSSSWSRSKFLDSVFMIGQKEVTRILILFLGLTASCLVLYKTAYPLQRLNVNNLSSLYASPSSPLPNINSSEISQETVNSYTKLCFIWSLGFETLVFGLICCLLQAKPKISFKEILENATTKNNTVIITTLNQAWAEPNSLFDLFLESFRIVQGTQQLLKLMGPYYINYGELNIVKNKIDKSIPKIKKRMIQLQRRDIISFLNSKYVP